MEAELCLSKSSEIFPEMYKIARYGRICLNEDLVDWPTSGNYCLCWLKKKKKINTSQSEAKYIARKNTSL